MPSTYTSRGYELMATGEQTDAWGTITNSNLSQINKNITANFAIATTGGTTTLSDADAANLSYTISGTLSSAATIVFPDRGGFYPISNVTTGAYTVTIKTSTGTGVTILQGAQTMVYSDGTNMLLANNATSDFVTGDLKWRYGSGALTGWLLCNGTTLGSASSGATQRANADCYALFVYLWPFTALTVSGGRGATADADWAANKTITTPDGRGRVLAGMDGMGTTAAGRLTSTTITGGGDTVGNSGGSQTVTLTSAQNGPHTHTATADVAGAHTHTVPLTRAVAGLGAGGNPLGIVTALNTSTSTDGDHTHTITVASSGSGDAHNNVQPTLISSIYIKL